MSIIKKCDVCGSVYEPYNDEDDRNNTNGFMFLNIDTYQNYYRHKPIDLCPECMCNMKLIIDVVKKKSKMLDSEKSCESCMFEKVNENDWVCSDCSGQNWFPKKPEDFLEEN